MDKKGSVKESPSVGCVAHKEGFMTENEQKVIDLMNRASDKDKAIKVALDLLASLLTSQGKTLEDLQEAS